MNKSLLLILVVLAACCIATQEASQAKLTETSAVSNDAILRFEVVDNWAYVSSCGTDVLTAVESDGYRVFSAEEMPFVLQLVNCDQPSRAASWTRCQLKVDRHLCLQIVGTREIPFRINRVGRHVTIALGEYALTLEPGGGALVRTGSGLKTVILVVEIIG
jgi:hypothetical protein